MCAKVLGSHRGAWEESIISGFFLSAFSYHSSLLSPCYPCLSLLPWSSSASPQPPQQQQWPQRWTVLNNTVIWSASPPPVWIFHVLPAESLVICPGPLLAAHPCPRAHPQQLLSSPLSRGLWLLYVRRWLLFISRGHSPWLPDWSFSGHTL